MAQYLMIAGDIKPFDGPVLTAPEVYELMMSNECWEFTDSAPHFKKMVPGDVLMFYLGGQKARYIAGEATIAAKPEPISETSPVTFNRSQIPYFTWRAPVKKIKRYKPGQAGLDIIEQLSFAKNSSVERKYIGLLLRGGCRPLTTSDLDLIRKASKPASATKT